MKSALNFRFIVNFANNCLQLSTVFFVITICALLGAQKVTAQEFNLNSMPPPEMYIEYGDAIKENSTLKVYITVPENWHVNANVVTDEFLKPSSIEVLADGVEFGDPQWPNAIKEYNEALELEILTFKGTFFVEIPIKSVKDFYDSLSTQVTFYYQACDNSICLAPAQKTIKLGEANLGLKKNDAEQVVEKFDIQIDIQNPTDEIVEENSLSIFALLFFAFVGGLILNLMPCVLPVLSLKLFSLIKQAHESRSRLIALGLSTTFGILISFWALASIVTLVKMGGGNAGWGMQFQSAGFIAFMVAILTFFAMSFFGVFEIWLPGKALTQMDNASKKQGLLGAFFTGALLVLLSTPCSAPFLGTAMGFAFAETTPILFVFFTAAGLGLALPYLLVSMLPKVQKLLPKPGLWMVKLQKVMGAFLLLTVIWLLWIVKEQGDFVGVALMFVIFILSLLGSFFVGKFAPPGVKFTREVFSVLLSALVLFAAWFMVISPKYEANVSKIFEAKLSAQMTSDGWYSYRPELIEDFKKEGRTVFIDVTADWCLTCKANEAATLNRREFLRAMDSLNVALVKADWTRETPEVNALLKSLKKSGVPAYAIYPRGDYKSQIVLPELLTIDGIKKIISEHSDNFTKD